MQTGAGKYEASSAVACFWLAEPLENHRPGQLAWCISHGCTLELTSRMTRPLKAPTAGSTSAAWQGLFLEMPLLEIAPVVFRPGVRHVRAPPGMFVPSYLMARPAALGWRLSRINTLRWAATLCLREVRVCVWTILFSSLDAQMLRFVLSLVYDSV